MYTESDRAYYERNKEEINQRLRQKYREAHPVREVKPFNQKEYTKAYNLAHKEEQRIYNASEKHKVAKKNWEINNRDKTRQYSKEHYWRNQEKCLQAAQNYRAQNPEKLRETWRKSSFKRNLIRNSRVAGVECTLTAKEWGEVLEQYNHCCAYCGADNKKLTLDHIVPLCKGGPTIKENAAPACKSCNSRKKDRDWKPTVFIWV